MAVKIAINGFGRIGRLAFRLMFGSDDYEIVAINDLTGAEDLAYLLKYDTAQGRYVGHTVSNTEDSIVVDGKEIKVYAHKDANDCPWAELDVDVVIECTGFYCSKAKSMAHVNAGAKKVVISAPAGNDLKTIVFNVNHETLTAEDQIVSAASCTTNCLAPMAKALNDLAPVQSGIMTTVHAYTGDQNTLDAPHKKGINSRRARAAAANIVPTTTGAAKAVAEVLPELKGRLDGSALRVPTVTGSVVDLVWEPAKHVTVEEINAAVKAAASETLNYTEDPIVSSDVIGQTCGSLFDAQCTSVMEVEGKQLVRVISWYDNEMSYTAQMVRTAKYLIQNIK